MRVRPLRLISAAILASALAALALPASAADSSAKCGASLLKSASKFCSKELSCYSKYAKSPAKDPGQSRLDACLLKNDASLEGGLAKNRGAACSIEESAVRLGVIGLANATRLGMLADWDPQAGDAADDAFRAAMLKAGGSVCSQALGVIAKDAGKPNEDARNAGMERALVGFVGAAAKASAKAGGRALDVQLVQAVIDNVRDTAEGFLPETGGAAEVVEVTSGDNHSCLQRDDNSVACWGDDSSGQASVPSEAFIRVSAGGSHSCGIRESDDQAECWGDDSFDQVADTPTDELGFVISAGGMHTCALRVDSTVVCWGADGFGQSTPPDPSRPYLDVSAGLFHTCALRLENDEVDCWGDNSSGQATPPASAFREISSGGQQSCGIQIGGVSICWGSTPQPPDELFVDITSGSAHSCAVDGNNFTAECWGAPGPWSAPPDNETFFQLSAGEHHTCGLRDSEPTVTCWGDDDHGQSSCAGVAGCTGIAPAPCQIANEGPRVGQAGEIVVNEVIGDPTNDYRLILPVAYLDVLRDLAPDNELIEGIVQAFDDRGFACVGDDRIALDFPAEAVEVVELLDALDLIAPLIVAIHEGVVIPIKNWLEELVLDMFREELVKCALEFLIFQSSCV